MNHYEYIYIDDEIYMRSLWELNAKKFNIKILTMNSVCNFYNHTDEISKEYTKIYLDSNLGAGQMKGEDFAKILHKEGYKNIFLATGYDSDNFVHLTWLKCVKKRCPFIQK